MNGTIHPLSSSVQSLMSSSEPPSFSRLFKSLIAFTFALFSPAVHTQKKRPLPLSVICIIKRCMLDFPVQPSSKFSAFTVVSNKTFAFFNVLSVTTSAVPVYVLSGFNASTIETVFSKSLTITLSLLAIAKILINSDSAVPVPFVTTTVFCG